MKSIDLLRMRAPLSFIFLISLLFFCISSGIVSAADSEKEKTAKILEGAKKEGELVYYGTMSIPDIEALMKRFKEKYPFIKTGIVRSGSDRLLTRVLAESRAKKYSADVIEIGGPRPMVLIKEGVLAKYPSPHWNFFPEWSKDPEGYWAAISVNFIVVAYNTKLVSPRDVPKTYDDLLAPKWKGKMMLPSDQEGWFAYMLRTMGEDRGLDYMRKLSTQDIQFRTGKTLVVQMTAAGEASLGLGVFNYRVEETKARGASIDWVALEPIATDNTGPSIAAHAPHPYAARLFIDFCRSKEGQEMIAGFFRVPARRDVVPKVPRLKCEGLKILPFDTTIANDWDRYTQLFRKVLMKK